MASVHCEAEADAYTLGQVAFGLTNGGVITGVDYGHGLVTGYGALGNRGHFAGQVYGGGYGGYGPYNVPRRPHYYGKREADSYTPYQVAAGLPVADAFATGHPHNVGYVAYTSYPSTGYRYPFTGYRYPNYFY